MRNFVSIITVNYNGKGYLEDFLESALSQDYPDEDYEVLVVDNGSTDDSVDYIKEKFPKVKVVLSQKNQGFGAGNNLGMKNAKGGLFFLVNNDTYLEKNALKNIVSSYIKLGKAHKIGAVNAKLVLMDSYLPLVIEEAYYLESEVSLGAEPLNSHVFVIPHETVVSYNEKVYVPLNNRFKNQLDIKIKIKPFRQNEFKIRLGNKLVYEGFLKTMNNAQEVNLKLAERDLEKYKTDLIQNAGNFYFRDGYGRDRGAVIVKSTQHYEPDNGQYDKEEIIPGFCGAGVLLNKKALSEVGYFDESFFMYYEDADLSMRLRENGWQVRYSPKAKIRHIHAGSSGEWSEFFVYNAERGRLLFLAKHWPIITAVWEWLKYIFRDSLAVPLYYISRGEIRRGLARFMTRLKINILLLPEFILGLFRLKRLNYREVRNFL